MCRMDDPIPFILFYFILEEGYMCLKIYKNKEIVIQKHTSKGNRRKKKKKKKVIGVNIGEGDVIVFSGMGYWGGERMG